MGYISTASEKISAAMQSVFRHDFFPEVTILACNLFQDIFIVEVNSSAQNQVKNQSSILYKKGLLHINELKQFELSAVFLLLI